MKKLMILMMLFGLMVVATERASAQKVCSKNLDGKQVYVEIANMTNKAFTVNLVDEKCKEVPSNQQVPSVEIFSQILTNGQAFHVREVGSNKLLHQFVVNPSKPLMLIETDLDGSKLRVRDFEVADDNDFQKRADAAFAAIKSETEDTSKSEVVATGSAAVQGNVALNKPATQSSTAYNSPASNAVNGNTNGTFGGKDITHTNDEKGAWWQVDLGKVYDIDRIVIWNRADDCCWMRLKNFYVMVSETEITSNSTTENVYSARDSFNRNDPFLLLATPSKGRYVRIFLDNGTLPLSLGEVQVFKRESKEKTAVVKPLKDRIIGTWESTGPNYRGREIIFTKDKFITLESERQISWISEYRIVDEEFVEFLHPHFTIERIKITFEDDKMKLFWDPFFAAFANRASNKGDEYYECSSSKSLISIFGTTEPNLSEWYTTPSNREEQRINRLVGVWIVKPGTPIDSRRFPFQQFSIFVSYGSVGNFCPYSLDESVSRWCGAAVRVKRYGGNKRYIDGGDGGVDDMISQDIYFINYGGYDIVKYDGDKLTLTVLGDDSGKIVEYIRKTTID